MRSLDPFFANTYVQRIIGACRESSAVQGILVEIHPQWLAAWRIGERYDPNDPDKGFAEAMAEPSVLIPGSPEEPSPTLPPPWLPFRPLTDKDLHWRPPFWPAIDQRDTYSQWPVVMRICLYPGGGRDGAQAPFFRGEGFAIRYEVRPVARLYAGPKDQHRPVLGGVSIGLNATDAGTIGGILRTPSGTHYGVTCAHVVGAQKDVEQPASIDNAGSLIGTVVDSHLPPAFPSYGAKRNPAGQKSYASKVDAALIEIDATRTSAKLEVLKMGRVTAIVSLSDIDQGEELQFTGRSSDWIKVQRSSISPYYNLTNKTTGDEYCYESPLIFRAPSGGAAAQPGDSGAWLCREVGIDYHWAAMVVGGDLQLGVAVAAEEVEAWWRSLARGYNLSVC